MADTLFTILSAVFTYGMPIIVLAAILGIRKNEGLWGNTITAMNASFAVLIALNYWEDIASLVAGQLPMGLYYWDFAAIWILFFVAFIILEEISKLLSRVKPQYSDTIGKVGTPLSGLCLFAIFFLFYTFTLHLAPLGNPSEQGGIPQYDLMRGKTYDVLSSGNLAPFISSNTFDSNKIFVDQNNRRIALKYRADSEATTSYEGEVPSRK